MLIMLLFTVLNYLVTKLNLHVCHSTCCNQVVKYYCLLVTHSIIQMNLKFLYLLLHSMIFNRQLLTNLCCVFEFTSTSCPRSLFDLVSNNRIKCVIWCFFIGRFSHKDKGNRIIQSLYYALLAIADRGALKYSSYFHGIKVQTSTSVFSAL